MAIPPGRRLERARRLMRVQEQMRRAAESDLAATRTRADALEADRAALLGTLGEGAYGHLFLEAANRRLRGLAAEAGALARTAEAQAEAVREAGLAQRRAEVGAERLGAALRTEAERRAALEQLEALVARGGASLP